MSVAFGLPYTDSLAQRAKRARYKLGFATICLTAAAAAPALGLPTFMQSLVIEVMIFAILAMSLDLLVGYTGLVSLGQAAFFGVAGYAVAIVGTHFTTDLLVTMPVAVLAAAVLAVPIGWLSIRLSGFYFLMITFAFAQMVYEVAYRWSWLTGGSDGMIAYGATIFGHPVLNSRAEIYYFTLVFFTLSWLALSWIAQSPFGRSLVGIRESTPRMRAIGYDVRRYKLSAFVLAAAFGGLAGAINVQFNLFVAPESTHWVQSALVLVMVLLGGAGTLVGPIVGAAVVLLLQHWLSSYTEYWSFVLGLLFVGFISFAREGIVGLLARLLRRRP